MVAHLCQISTFFKSTGLDAHVNLNEQWLGFPDLNVIQEDPTCWGSFLRSGKRFLENQDNIKWTLLNKNREDLWLLSSEWSLLRDLCNILQIFHNETVKVSGTTYPTLNLVEPSLREIKVITDVTKPLPKDWGVNLSNMSTLNKFGKSLHDNLLTTYTEDSLKNKLTLAACLDPRNFLK